MSHKEAQEAQEEVRGCIRSTTRIYAQEAPDFMHKGLDLKLAPRNTRRFLSLLLCFLCLFVA